MSSIATLHALAIVLAGHDFNWSHADAPSSINSAHRRGLTDILAADIQGGVCPACGDEFEIGEAVQLCHIVASRKSSFGVMAGNVYAGHIGCNDDDYKMFGDIVPLTSFARGDLLTDSLPTRKACVERATMQDAKRASRRNARPC